MTPKTQTDTARQVNEKIKRAEPIHARIQVLGSLASFIAMAGSMAIMISLTLV